MPTLNEFTPVLRSFDEAKAKEFYVGFLGFQVLFEHRLEDGLPLYMGLEKDGLHLHLTEHHGDAAPGTHLRIRVSDIKAYNQELLGKNYKHARPGLSEPTP